MIILELEPGEECMTVVPRKSMPVLPKSHEIELAGKASAEMRTFLSGDWKGDVQFSLRRATGKGSTDFLLPPAIVEFLFSTLLHVAEGNAVTLVPIHAELTTQEAANLLNVSRPYLIQLLEKGKIKFHKIGRHRRILFADILKYQEQSKSKSRRAQEELTKEAQDLDLGY